MKNITDQLSQDEFDQWLDHPVTQLVIQLHKDRRADILSFVEDAMESATVLSETQQLRFHAALIVHEDFIELVYQDLVDFYQERD